MYRQAPLGVSVEPTYTVPGRHCVEIDRFRMASLSKIKYFGWVRPSSSLFDMTKRPILFAVENTEEMSTETVFRSLLCG